MGAEETAETAPYGVGNWEEGERGNHRARVRVEAPAAGDKAKPTAHGKAKPADAVVVHIPWRRRDLHPERKNVVVVDAATGEVVANTDPHPQVFQIQAVTVELDKPGEITLLAT